ncbi:MAG: hypothetical protein A3J55_02495 [Candidatus Ryanbacteria bacterium RIFCSPHIGHO2_02_FULL_45_17b]|uniref:Glycosyltransferase 2-like domain-containing protein n=1 Tax=Candidatus Ryanbacteria bacterium RIFCSPHIGHO2_01_FULL_45_22 TaxID=1802114 RepID=A0A1G2FYV1_9BACT|nr:MAG: hypothetical protein A2719_00935 [Candidatus Ryanbacteria bacterium RIFCSPHIGHO2_01_FULL_45_22]OGZ46796.1 MAG: hypothetical protein A3J55_02495 [Candidatus Ryanbacteria bacterium RIFCSPHIGHO2_02_FULL_45_17b]
MSIPLVSVSIPTFNRAPLLRRSIESILNQTFTDFELIIVDDGSTDDTKSLIDSFHDPRIRYIRHETKKGLYPSRNTCIKNSVGTYIALQDSDDEWHPKKLGEEVALIQGTPDMIGGVFSQIEKVYFSGIKAFVPPVNYTHTNNNLLTTILRGDFYITMQALLFKRACLENIGEFDENFRVFGDGDFIVRLAEHYEFLYNPHVRVTLHVSEDSISRNKSDRRAAREQLFLKHRILYMQYPDISAEFAYTLGHAFATVREYNFGKARDYARLAFITKPFRSKYLFLYIYAYIQYVLKRIVKNNIK